MTLCGAIGIVKQKMRAKIRCSRSGDENSWGVTLSREAKREASIRVEPDPTGSFALSAPAFRYIVFANALYLRMNLGWIAFAACL
jgi:hypothetical protein